MSSCIGHNSKSNNMQTEHAVMNRMEIVQDVIDRLLYLSDNDRKAFLDKLNGLFKSYAIDVQVVGGLRIYKTKRHESNQN